MKLYVLTLILLPFCLGWDNGLGKTPQMGWNSWNFYGCGINETIVMEAAQNLVKSGLADLGYVYVIIDDCWAWNRTKDGVINPDPTTFPSGMQYLARYVHKLGLKFGLYSSAGTYTCAGRPGSLGYEEIDAMTYATWGLDYLKYDNCNGQTPPQGRYPVMRDALNKTDRPIFFSMSEWGVNLPWQWASRVGNSWRTDIDIGDYWESLMRVLYNQKGLSPFAGPGAWNDPDMLEVGNGGMLFIEYRTHFAFWCLLKAPLLTGTDLNSLSSETLFILGAKELIAVNQDPLGAQAELIWQVGSQQIWAGPLADGSRAFILLNTGTLVAGSYNTTITIQFQQLGFPHGTTGVVRDLYAQGTVGTYTDIFSHTIDPHDVFAGKFTPIDDEIRMKYRDWRPL